MATLPDSAPTPPAARIASPSRENRRENTSPSGNGRPPRSLPAEMSKTRTCLCPETATSDVVGHYRQRGDRSCVGLGFGWDQAPQRRGCGGLVTSRAAGVLASIRGRFEHSSLDPAAEYVELALGDLGGVRRHVRFFEVRGEQIKRAVLRLPSDRGLPAHAAGRDAGIGRQIELAARPLRVVAVPAVACGGSAECRARSSQSWPAPVLRKGGRGDAEYQEHNRGCGP